MPTVLVLFLALLFPPIVVHPVRLSNVIRRKLSLCVCLKSFGLCANKEPSCAPVKMSFFSDRAPLLAKMTPLQLTFALPTLGSLLSIINGDNVHFLRVQGISELQKMLARKWRRFGIRHEFRVQPRALACRNLTRLLYKWLCLLFDKICCVLSVWEGMLQMFAMTIWSCRAALVLAPTAADST
jgi:hypothetical protein